MIFDLLLTRLFIDLLSRDSYLTYKVTCHLIQMESNKKKNTSAAPTAVLILTTSAVPPANGRYHSPASKGKQSKWTQHTQNVHTISKTVGENRIGTLYATLNFIRNFINQKKSKKQLSDNFKNCPICITGDLKGRTARTAANFYIILRFSIPKARTGWAKVFSVASEGKCAFVTQFTAARVRQGAARRLVAQWRACALRTATRGARSSPSNVGPTTPGAG